MSASLRVKVWRELGNLAPRLNFDPLVDSTIDLQGLDGALDTIAQGSTRGRIIVVPK
jgi:hypothetical protein